MDPLVEQKRTRIRDMIDLLSSDLAFASEILGDSKSRFRNHRYGNANQAIAACNLAAMATTEALHRILKEYRRALILKDEEPLPF